MIRAGSTCWRLASRTAGALALLLALAGPARATQDAWPALFDVTGVAVGDVLHVRAGPGVAHAAIGALARDAAGVEVIAPDASARWGRVNLAEGAGWVSMRHLARRPGQWAGAFPEVSACFGTEPFWQLRIDGDAVAWSTPEGDAAGRVTGRLGSVARRDRHGLVAVLDGAPLTGVISAEACSDGMSDRVHGGDVLSGCCTLVP